MAYLLTNLEYFPMAIAKDMEEVKLKETRWQAFQLGKIGHLVEISNSDFVSLQTALKDIVYDGTNTSLIDRERIRFSQNAEELQNSINLLVQQVDDVIPKYVNTSFETELNNYKTNLQSIDTSSISYPMDVSIEQYLLNQNKSILGYLQLV